MSVDLHAYGASPLSWPGCFMEHARLLLRPLRPIAHSCYVERRLGPAASTQTDLLLSFRPRVGPALYQLAQTRPGESWRAIERVCEAWRSGQCAGVLWMELDHVERSAAASPSIHTCLISGYRTDTSLSESGEQAKKIAQEIRTHLGEAAPAAMVAAQQQLLSVAPRGTTFIHVSSMLGRAQPTLKLYARVPQAELLGYLERCAWPGGRTQGEALLATAFPHARTGGELFADLTVGPEGVESVGLALPQQYVRAGQEQRRAVLDDLRDAGLCTLAQRDALAAWPGKSPVEGSQLRIERRWLDLKLVWRTGEALTAKAYLGLSRRPASPFEMIAHAGSSHRRSEGSWASAPL